MSALHRPTDRAVERWFRLLSSARPQLGEPAGDAQQLRNDRTSCDAAIQEHAHGTVEAARLASAARPELAAIHAKAVEAAGERYAAEKANRG
jgi:hypothetical protein